MNIKGNELFLHRVSKNIIHKKKIKKKFWALNRVLVHDGFPCGKDPRRPHDIEKYQTLSLLHVRNFVFGV